MAMVTLATIRHGNPVLTRVQIRELRAAVRSAPSGSLRLADLHARAKEFGLRPWEAGFRWPISETAYAAYRAAQLQSEESRMALDLSNANRVDRAAKGIASDAIRAIGLIAQIDADEAADVCRGVSEYIAKFRSEVIAAARREEYPAGFDPFEADAPASNPRLSSIEVITGVALVAN
jgi:hypothetical protein